MREGKVRKGGGGERTNSRERGSLPYQSQFASFTALQLFVIRHWLLYNNLQLNPYKSQVAQTSLLLCQPPSTLQRVFFQWHRRASHWVSPSGFNMAESAYRTTAALYCIVLYSSSFFYFTAHIHLSFSVCLIQLLKWLLTAAWGGKIKEHCLTQMDKTHCHKMPNCGGYTKKARCTNEYTSNQCFR